MDQLYYYEKLFIIHLRGIKISFLDSIRMMVDSFEEAGAHAQNTLNVTDGVNTLFTEEEENV